MIYYIQKEREVNKMTIVKNEMVELTCGEYATIKKCIKLMKTVEKGATDPILKDEADQVTVALEKFHNHFITFPTEEEEDEKG